MEFVTKCNYRGRYLDLLVPELFIFPKNTKEQKLFKKCKIHRNYKDWFEKCSF